MRLAVLAPNGALRPTALIVLLAGLGLLAVGVLSPSNLQAEAGGLELNLYRLANERADQLQSVIDPSTGESNQTFPLIRKDRPTGPFGVRLYATTPATFSAASSILTVTNATIEDWAAETGAHAGYTFTVVPAANASSVSVSVAEDAFTHNGKGNQAVSGSWTASDSDAPLVMAMHCASDNIRTCNFTSYSAGQHLDFVLVYSEQVNVTHGANKPYLTFDVNGTEKNATYLDGSGTEVLRFRYTVESGFPNNGYPAIISANVGMPSGATIRETKSSNPKNALTALPPAPVYMEYPRPMTSTEVTEAPEGAAAGTEYEYRVRFNQPVTVRGTPGIAVEFTLAGSTTNSMGVCAPYVRSINSRELLFRYVVPQNHGFNPAHVGVVKHYMCASESSRITNTAGTQDATYTLYSTWDRVGRVDIGESRRLWLALGAISVSLDYVLTFSSSDSDLLRLVDTELTYLGCGGVEANCDTRANMLIPQKLEFEVSSDQTDRGKSAQIFVNFDSRATDGTVTRVVSDRPLLRVILGGPPPVSAPATVQRSPDPPNLARGDIQWQPVGAQTGGGMHALPTRMDEISSNEPSGASGSVDLGDIAASVREERQRHTRGYYLTTRVYGLSERPYWVRSLPGGGRYIEDESGQRYGVPAYGSLLLVKIWHVYYHAERGHNSIELLGEAFYPRLDNRLTEPVKVCLPAPRNDAERARFAVRGRLDPDWTVLETTVEDGQVCAETVRVAWLVLVLAPEAEAA